MQPFKALRRLAERFRAQTPTAETVVNGPAGDDLPTVEEIEAAAERHEEGRTQYNEGARIKRASRRVLDRVPTGLYGPWSVSWVQSARREWDRDAIEAVFRELGREVPTRTASPQLKLTQVVPDLVAPEPEAAPSQPVPMPVDADAAETAPDAVAAIFGAAKPSGLAA